MACWRRKGCRWRSRGEVPAALSAVRRWDGTPLPAELHARLGREWTSVVQLTARIDAAQGRAAGGAAGGARGRGGRRRERADARRGSRVPGRLYALRGIGDTGAWTYVREFFGWREFRNRRAGRWAGRAHAHAVQQRGESAGARDEQSGQSPRALLGRRAGMDLGPLSAAERVESLVPARFGHGSSRLRRIGIVALARKLLIALWRYLETGVVPEGAILKV